MSRSEQSFLFYAAGNKALWPQYSIPCRPKAAGEHSGSWLVSQTVVVMLIWGLIVTLWVMMEPLSVCHKELYEYRTSKQGAFVRLLCCLAVSYPNRISIPSDDRWAQLANITSHSDLTVVGQKEAVDSASLKLPCQGSGVGPGSRYSSERCFTFYWNSSGLSLTVLLLDHNSTFFPFCRWSPSSANLCLAC